MTTTLTNAASRVASVVTSALTLTASSSSSRNSRDTSGADEPASSALPARRSPFVAAVLDAVYNTTASLTGGGGAGLGLVPERDDALASSAAARQHREYYLSVGGSSGSSIADSSSSSSSGGGGSVNRTFSGSFLDVVEHGTSSIYNYGSAGIAAAGGGDHSSIITSGASSGSDGGHLFGNDINDSASGLSSFYDQLFSRKEFKMADDITRYVYPVIILVGNISNIEAFLVLSRKKFKASSVAFYMCAYAVANLCVLNLVLGVSWLCHLFEIPYLAHHTDWSCRLWTFVSNVITYSGIWFVVVMSIDRCVFTYFPHKASGYCTVFTAKAIVSFVLICLVVVSIHAMWTFELQPQGCYVSYHQNDLHTLTWPWWSATLYSYIPLLLLLVQIVAHGANLCLRRYRKHTPSSGGHHQCGEQEAFLRPVFVITVAFFFLTVPSTVINLLDIHLPTSLLKVDVIAKIELTKIITEVLSSVNNSLLGVVLFVCTPDYRVELLCLLRQFLCCCSRRRKTLMVFEMRTMSNSEDSSPHIQVDYELCNNNEEPVVTDV